MLIGKSIKSFVELLWISAYHLCRVNAPVMKIVDKISMFNVRDVHSVV